MPWMKRKRDGQWCVYKKGTDGQPTGQALGCHDTEDEANAQIAALEVNVDEMIAQIAPEGTIEALREDLDNAIQQATGTILPAGSAWIRFLYPDYLIVELWSEDEGTRLYRVQWYRDEAGELMLADAVEVEEVITFRPVVAETGTLMQMSLRQPVRGTWVGQMKGSFPDVPLAEGVDLEALTAGDDDPVFLTLPVAQIGATSVDRVEYDEDLAGAILEQVNAKRPVGIMGHIREDDLGSAFPPPDVHWVGAMLDGQTVWAKGYLPPERPSRPYVRRQKATGGKVATSIFGTALVEQTADGVFFREFELEQLDLAPYERAALQLGGAFQVTAQMQNKPPDGPSPAGTALGPGTKPHRGTNSQQTEEHTMDRSEVLQSLTPADVPALPEAVRQAIITAYEQDGAAERIQQLVTERDEAVTRADQAQAQVGELTTEVTQFRRQAFEAAVNTHVAQLTDWPAQSEQGKAKLAALRGTMARRVVAKMAADPEHAQDETRLEQVVRQLWEAEFKPLAETVRDALAGPGAFVPGADNGANGVGSEGWRQQMAERAEEKRQQIGA